MEYKNHKYYLTIQEVNAEFNLDLIELMGEQKEAMVIINDITSTIYAYLKAHYSQSYREIEYLLFKNEDLKDSIQEILLAQMRYAIRSDGDMVGDSHLINRRLGTVIDVKARSQVVLSDTVYKLIHSTFSYAYDFEVTEEEYRVGY